MRREEVAFGSVADLTFRFRHNKACTVFSHLGALRAIGNDSTTVPQIRKLTNPAWAREAHAPRNCYMCLSPIMEPAVTGLPQDFYFPNLLVAFPRKDRRPLRDQGFGLVF
ncbi:hypothetical protein HanIR_Chr11g0540571 [Helianthus annuus]|nr:hypothetical protein HanIR_Chr11g0540571 [Helianthus annuus]